MTTPSGPNRNTAAGQRLRGTHAACLAIVLCAPLTHAAGVNVLAPPDTLADDPAEPIAVTGPEASAQAESYLDIATARAITPAGGAFRTGSRQSALDQVIFLGTQDVAAHPDQAITEAQIERHYRRVVRHHDYLFVDSDREHILQSAFNAVTQFREITLAWTAAGREAPTYGIPSELPRGWLRPEDLDPDPDSAE
ncbi:MAG: hypothetical protein AAF610_05455 [Pseudomonadota bacterium]